MRTDPSAGCVGSQMKRPLESPVRSTKRAAWTRRATQQAAAEKPSASKYRLLIETSMVCANPVGASNPLTDQQ